MKTCTTMVYKLVSLDYFVYNAEIDKQAETMINFSIGKDHHNFDFPIAVNFSSDKNFPSINQLYSMSQV